MEEARLAGDAGHAEEVAPAKPSTLLEVLVEQGIVKDSGALDDELRELAGQDQKAFGEALVERGLVLNEDLLKAWAQLLEIPFRPTLETKGVRSEILSRIPIHFARRHKLVPVTYDEEGLCVAMADPLSIEAIDDLYVKMGMEILPVLSPEAEVTKTINQLYHESGHSTEEIIADLELMDDAQTLQEEDEDLLDATTEAPVIKFVNTILSQAVRARASDIHIEPFYRDLKVRYRVDGVLFESFSPPPSLHAAIVSRVKVMAKMNIAEKRLPQDGRIPIKIANRSFDLRVSTLPTTFGERVVLRLLDKTSILLGLEEIGLDKEQMDILKKLIVIPNGIILVTGPTGSGKTTTLYGSLNHINSPDKNIITIEDPVEYQLPGIGQIQVNAKIGLKFANGLRSIVRQDPDVILVGEIRDSETAEISIHAALTGHLVFSTLHTNNAAGAITRLIDMGIEPFLVASSMRAIIAQRLVRKICPECKEAYRADARALQDLGMKTTSDEVVLYRGRGCDSCLNMGYRGRTAIFEFLIVDDKIRSLMTREADAATLEKAAVEAGMKTLHQDGIEKVLKGVTTVEEILRATGE